MSENVESLDRLNACTRLVESLRNTYPDAKKFQVNICFEWQETDTFSDGAELCPVVDINIERS
jgi:hypothetical protein